MNWLQKLFGWLFAGRDRESSESPSTPEADSTSLRDAEKVPARERRRIRLSATRRRAIPPASRTSDHVTPESPYLFAWNTIGWFRRKFLDLAQDEDAERLQQFGLPAFRTPQQLADWLGIRVGQLAWLVHRSTPDRRPADERQSHYVYRWVRKRSARLEAGTPHHPVSSSWRLIEAPKQMLKAAQKRILTEILNKVPAHPAAHGFVQGRSIVTNAKPHVGQAVVIKLDLRNFYPNVTYSRVVAIFRSLGYCREAAIWLARLTTSAIPWSMSAPDGDEETKALYVHRHLPQGAPTSPAIANLSAFGLDIRLTGLLKTFGGNYTRYADDLTLSGPDDFRYALRCVIPLAEQIVRSERFLLNHRKRRVVRHGRRQVVTGVVVNQKTNVRREEFDRLKAILTNCVKLGPSTQNRESRDDFAAHLRGRIAFVKQLNPTRGDKLLRLFEQIDWQR